MKVGDYIVKSQPDQEVTGTLEHWYIDNTTAYGYTLVRGDIYGDINKRWDDGTYIRSSALVGDNFDSLKSGDVVRTLNSRYLLGEPRSDLGS